MKKTAALVLAVAVSCSLAGCAAPAASGPSDAVGDLRCVPSFCADGRLRRDLATDAPLFTAPADALAARAPRFNDDGTVCRDSESAAPLYEDVSGGEVVRVLVLPQR